MKRMETDYKAGGGDTAAGWQTPAYKANPCFPRTDHDQPIHQEITTRSIYSIPIEVG